MTTAHEQLAQIARQGESRYSHTALSDGHASVTRRVRGYRAVRATAGTVAGIGVIGGATWGGIAAFGQSDALAPGAVTIPSTTVSASVSPPSSTAAPTPATAHVGTGGRVEDLAEFLADGYGISLDEASAAIAAAVAAQVPEATSDEGWFAPGDYSLDKAPTAREAANLMVSARVQELTDLGVARSDWQTVLTKASLVESDARLDVDKPKVARVIDNRLANDMKLELDSTIFYVANTDGPFTTEQERAIDSPYNTYLYPGLPPGAIMSPSDASIQAVLNPAEGDWLFFVTVNFDTGEIAYASTFPDFQKNIQTLHDWEAAQEAASQG